MLTVACTSPGSSAAQGSRADPPAPPAPHAPQAEVSTAVDSDPARGGCSLEPGSTTYRIDVEGTERVYHVTVGPAARGSAPVVFVWHGFGGGAQDLARRLDPASVWPEAIVVAPVGLGRTFEQFGDVVRPGWQIRTGEYGDRDLAFFDRMLVDVKARYCIDDRRIYSTGFSNGGFISNLLGCVRGEVLAAIAPVGGGGPFGDCPHPMPIHAVHGTRDDVVPYAAALATAESWRRTNGCSSDFEPPERGCAAAPGCRAAVELCSFEGSHHWPVETTAPLVEFFRRTARH